jgi:hypothetical protein
MNYTYSDYRAVSEHTVFAKMRLETAYTPNSESNCFPNLFHYHLDFLRKILNTLIVLL